MRAELLLAVGIIALSFAAEKCRQLMGEEYSSKSSKERFKFFDCFDMGYGTIACLVKECVKLYFYYMRAAYIHRVRVEATISALAQAQAQDRTYEEGLKLATEEGRAAAKRASREAKHIMGPIISSGWDFFETLYVKGTLAEGTIRGIGTFFGAYAGGIIGEGKLGWVGFLVGSQLGSWLGGRTGLMAYDVGNGIMYLLHIFNKEKVSHLGFKDPSL